jgi:S-adenosylmethionine synthetase
MTTNLRIDAIVISTQHDDFDEESVMLAKIKKDSVDFDSKNHC